MGLDRLIKGRVLARNAVLNLVGQILPMAAGLICVPVLVHRLGPSRYGVLTIALACLGYFNLFDLGLGRAVTQSVAARLGAGEDSRVPGIIWTSQIIMWVAGIVGMIGFALATPWVTGKFLSIPEEIRNDSRIAFYMMAIAIPVVVTMAGFRGALEAKQQFQLVNYIRIPSGVLSYVCPMVVCLKFPTLTASVAALVIVRLLSWGAYVAFCIDSFPGLVTQVRMRFEEITSLLRFGSWITVSNVLGPLMTYMDRLLLGGLLPVSAIGYYAVAYDVGSQILVIPGAVVSVLFAAYAAGFSISVDKTGILFSHGLDWIYATLFPIVLATTAFAPEIFAIWLGRDVGPNCAGVFSVLAAGILCNGITLVPFALIQAAGRSDLTAKIHLIELPVYALAFLVLTRAFGIAGTALAWSLRCALDCALMFGFAHRLLPVTRKIIFKTVRRALAGLIALVLLYFLRHWVARTAFLFAVLALHAGWIWVAILTSTQRERILSLSRRSMTWLGFRFRAPEPG